MKKITNTHIARFKNHLIEEEKSDNTTKKYIRDVTFFMVWLNGREVKKALALKYKNELCEKYAPTSANAAISSLNSFFAFMHWQDMYIKPLKIQRRIYSIKDKELTKAEYERLLTAAKNNKMKRLYLLIQTICSTGIRVSELKFITCESVKIGKAIISCKCKVRTIFLPKELCKMLKKYITEQGIKAGSVFVSKNGNPLDRSYIWKTLKKLCEIAGVLKSKVFPHNFRHPYVKLKLKISSAYHCRIFGTKVLDFPLDFKPVIGIYAHLFNEHIRKCLC